MTYETSNESNATGEEVSDTITENKGIKSDVDNVRKDYETLKAINDKMEGELLRGEQLRAKARQGGKAEAGQEPEVKEVSAEDYAKDALAGNVGDGKEE